MPQWFSIHSLSWLRACLWLTVFCWSSVFVDGRSLWSSFPWCSVTTLCPCPSLHLLIRAACLANSDHKRDDDDGVSLLQFQESCTQPHSWKIAHIYSPFGPCAPHEVPFNHIIFMLPKDLSRISRWRTGFCIFLQFQESFVFTWTETSMSDQAQMKIQPKFASMATHLLMFLSSVKEHCDSGFHLWQKKEELFILQGILVLDWMGIVKSTKKLKQRAFTFFHVTFS